MINTTGKRLAVTGAILQAGTLIGLIGTITGMVSAFQRMGAEGLGNTADLAGDIGTALISTAVGYSIALAGVALMMAALFACKYKEPWFFWFLMIISLPWLPLFPYGTIGGSCLLIYLIGHRKDFLTPRGVPPPLPGSAPRPRTRTPRKRIDRSTKPGRIGHTARITTFFLRKPPERVCRDEPRKIALMFIYYGEPHEIS